MSACLNEYFYRDRGDRGGRGFSNYEPARDRDGGRYGGFSRGDNDRGFSRDGDRGGDRGGYRDREREAPKERPRLNLAPRSKEVAESGDGPSSATSSIFGGAKPVDTLKKEKEIEEKLQKEKEEKEKAIEEAKKNKPSAASIFGGAKPVDTTQREKEIEEKLSKMSASEEKEDQPRAYRPPARRDDGDGRDDRRGGGSYRSRDDRDYGRRDYRDNRGDRRDGGSDRRSYDRDRRSESDQDDHSKDAKSKSPEPPVKKYEEPKPVVSFIDEPERGESLFLNVFFRPWSHKTSLLSCKKKKVSAATAKAVKRIRFIIRRSSEALL